VTDFPALISNRTTPKFFFPLNTVRDHDKKREHKFFLADTAMYHMQIVTR